MKKTILLICFLAPALTGCSGLSKLDYWNLHRRAGWQLPDRVLESLNLQPGDRVADIGAGGGYFTFILAEAVGPGGRVYAVDVEEEITRELEEKASADDYGNVVVILGEFADPLLPDGTVDLAFLCNTYHHIENREEYFSDLKADLQPEGRVAIIDMKDDLSGILSLFATAEHWTERELMIREMEEAGYRHANSFDFLPVQNFEMFAVN